MKEHKTSSLAFLCLLLCIAGAVLSFLSLEHFVAVKHHVDTSGSLCNINSAFDCDAVNRSKWSSFLGFPLAGYGLLFYVSVGVFSAFQFLRKGVALETFAQVLISLSLVASLFSFSLFIISKVYIGALCLHCMGMYLVNFGLLIVSIFLPRGEIGLLSAFFKGFQHLFYWPLFGFGIGVDKERSRKSFALTSFVLFLLLAVICLPLSEPVVHALMIDPQAVVPEERQQGADVPEQGVVDWEKEVVAQLSVKGEEVGALSRDFTKGNPKAPVQIVEYFDYECPACRKMYFVLKQLLQKYPNQISITLKNYPLDRTCNPAMQRQIHRFACFGSYFARCAGEQGKFWEATDLVFESEVLNSYDNQEDIEYALYSEAKSRGIDVNAIKECISSGRQNAKVVEDISSGNSLGVMGTPTLWVNGKKIARLSLPTLEGIVSKILNDQPGATAPAAQPTEEAQSGIATF